MHNEGKLERLSGVLIPGSVLNQFFTLPHDHHIKNKETLVYAFMGKGLYRLYPNNSGAIFCNFACICACPNPMAFSRRV